MVVGPVFMTGEEARSLQFYLLLGSRPGCQHQVL